MLDKVVYIYRSSHAKFQALIVPRGLARRTYIFALNGVLKRSLNGLLAQKLKREKLDFLLEAVKQAANPVLLLYHAT